MTELALIATIGGLCLAFAVMMARSVLRRPVGEAGVLKMSRVVDGGVRRYLRRQDLVVLAASGVLGAAVFLVYGAAYQVGWVSAVAPRAFGAWLGASFALGVALATAAGRAAARVGGAAGARVASAAKRSVDDTLHVGIRAAAASATGTLAAGVLALAGLLAVAGLVGPRVSTSIGGASGAAPIHLVGFALGVAFVALLVQLGGGTFAKVADVGADIGGKVGASLPEDSGDNPATVADLVGDVVGDHAARTTGALAAVVCQVLGAMLLAGWFVAHNETALRPAAFVAFPLVTQAFALLAACFGAMVVRTDDREVPTNALGRGLLVATLLHAVAAVGAAKWLLAGYWASYSVCAVVGAVTSLLCLYLVQYYSDAKFRPVRLLAEAARAGPTLAVLRGLLGALEGSTAVLLLLSSAAFACFEIGQSTGLQSAGLFGVAVGGLGLLGSLPFVLAMHSLGSIVDGAGGLVALTLGSERPDVRARARMLDAVGNTSKGLCSTLLSASTTIGCFVLSVAFSLEIRHRYGAADPAHTASGSRALLLAGALLGALVVFLFVWASLGRIVQATREFLLEIRSQLAATVRGAGAHAPEAEAEGGPRLLGAGPDQVLVDAGLAVPESGPGGASPAGRVEGEGSRPQPRDAAQLVCVEMVSRLALRGMLPPTLLGVGLPLLLGVALRIQATGDRVVEAAEALVALLLVATIAGALGSLLFSYAGSAWDNAKRYIETGAHGGRYVPNPRPARLGGMPPRSSGIGPAGNLDEWWEDNPTYVAAVVGDTIGDPLKGVVGPATQALVQTLATLALVFLPFFL